MRRQHNGGAAVRAGTPDYGSNDPQTDLMDALANVMHYASAAGLDFDGAVDRAREHFEHEVEHGATL
jgi:hypothetical protein